MQNPLNDGLGALAGASDGSFAPAPAPAPSGEAEHEPTQQVEPVRQEVEPQPAIASDANETDDLDKKKKKKKHKMRIEHQTKGRVRMKFSSAKGDAKLLREIGDTFSAIPGLEKISINAETGSVVLHYDHERHDDFHAHLSRQCGREPEPPPPTEIDELASKIEREAEFLAEHSHTAKAIVHICKHFDREIKQRTNNSLDLKLGLAGAIIAFTLLEVGAGAATPVWLTLGVFSLNHFVEMQSRHDLEERIKKGERKTAQIVDKTPKVEA